LVVKRDDFRRHAAAGVRDRQHHVLARRHFRLVQDVVIVQHGVVEFEREPAVALHRVARIDGQVQDHVLELVRVGHGGPQAACHHGLDLHRFAEGAPQQLVHAAQDAADVGRHRLQRMAARKRQ
jgi:hypothetical protein